jgi:pimeloyl-ACP methyl ester carboxylesterase
VQACDIRLHRSFILPPNPRIGRDKPIRVTYSDVGYLASIPGEPGDRPDKEVPSLLWCGGQFGGRYQAFAYDELAKKHKIRFLAIDRPGIGGTQAVPLDQRIATWLDMVSALLDHVKIKHVHLASHSAGTIFVLDTILHLRHLLHPTRPYVALFGPWVPPSISGKWGMATVGKLPPSWIGKWHYIAKFINNNVAPAIVASGMTITKSSRASITSISESKATATDAARTVHEEMLWKKASESVITSFIFAEEVEGASQEALLCLQKCHVKWGDWNTVDEAVSRIATNEKSHIEDQEDAEQQKLKIRIFFAEDDELVGKGGQAYLENCFAAANVEQSLDFHSEVVPGTDHGEVLSVSRGAIEKVMQEIGALANEEQPEPISLRALLESPMTP